MKYVCQWCVVVFMCGGMMGESAYAQTSMASGLEVVLSCPAYWPGPPAQGNDPVQGAARQAMTLTYGADELIECMVYYSHTGGVALQDVTLALQMPARADHVWVSQPQELPDGNPYEAARGQVGVFGVRDVMTQAVSPTTAGVVGAYEPLSQRHVWSLGQVSPGDAGQLGVQWRAAPGPQGDETLRLSVSDAQVELMAPREVPVRYTGGMASHGLTGVAPLVVDRTVGRLGAKHILRQQGQGRRHADAVMVVNLPYWDGAVVRADGGYDAMNPQHVPMAEQGGLQARVVMGGDTLVGRLEPGSVTGPALGANARKIIRHNAVSQQIEVQLGSPGEVVEVSWSAPLALRTLPEGTAIPHQSCWASASSPRSCTTVGTSVLGTESLLAPQVTYQGLAYDARGAVPTNGVTESSALSARVARVIQGVDVRQANSIPAEDYEVIVQAPGDTVARAEFREASWGVLFNQAFATSGLEQSIHVSVVASGYGSPGSLTLRAMPAASASDWVRCDDALGAPSGACTMAHLQALGIQAAQVQEVRFYAERLPPRHESAIEPGDVQRASERLDVTWRLSASVQDSIGGTVGYDPDVLTGRSVGGLTQARSEGGLSPASGSLFRVPRSAEVDTRAVDALPGISGAGANSWSAPAATVAPGKNAYVGIRLFNDGAQTNMFGPFEFRMTLPEGFEPNSALFFPIDTMQPRVRVGRTNGSGGTLWNWNDSSRISSTYLFDPLTREYRVIVETRHPQGGLVPMRDVGQGTPAADEVGDLIVLVHGDVLVGAPDRLEVVSASVTCEVVEDGTRQSKTIPLQPTAFESSPRSPRFRITGEAPARVAAYQSFDYTLRLYNDAYDESGRLLDPGATGPASEVVVYQPVTKPGDHPQVEQGRASSVLQSAHAPEARAIWVSTQPGASRPIASSLGTSSPPVWRRCSQSPQACDAATLGAMGLLPEQVRWVAFEFGDIALTDVEPRGVEPRRDTSRAVRPYLMHLSVSEDGSNQDAVLRTLAYTTSGELPGTQGAAVDIIVDASCDTRQAFVGFDQAERCDGVDNDCDGQIDEDFGLASVCDVDFGGCVVQGMTVCDASGAQVCDTSALANADGDPFPDVCDCAPQNASRFDVLPWTDTSCDYDGDGDCNAAIAQLNPAVCVRGVLDCDDYNPLENSWAFELCDDQDNDCDGQIDEGYAGLGQGCSVGQGSCRRDGQSFCGGDALSVVCDAVPGAPVTEACDGADNDCDGQIDEDFITLGEACTVGLGLCARQGAKICSPDGLAVRCDASPGAGQPEACNALDDDCDGQVDEDFVLGPGCVVRFPGGCEATGVGFCAADGLGANCVLDAPADADADGFPDVCDCAPQDASRNSLEPGDLASCDVDGDGWCDARIEGLDPQVCTQQGDCNDAVARINPGATELCNGVDEDCDGDIDETFSSLGAPCSAGEGTCRNVGVEVCAPDAMGVVCSAVPGQLGAPERCDGSDNDCDGQIDEGFEDVGAACDLELGGCVVSGVIACASTGDGSTCAPRDPSDFDEDGTLDACDCAPELAARASMTPGAQDSCDGDGDGWCEAAIRAPNPALCVRSGDCDDAVASTYPDAPERCDGGDNDCDGQIDEDFSSLAGACTAGEGACAARGEWVCDATQRDVMCSVEPRAPVEESCNGVDDDCDGQVDEDFGQLGQACAAGEGSCMTAGLFVCGESGELRCDAQPGDVQSDELCNGVDDDCDGQIDEDFGQLGQACVAGEGACAARGVWVCDRGEDAVRCDAVAKAPLEESCNGVDDDCDGQVDEELVGCDVEPPVDEEPPDYAVYGTGFCASARGPGGHLPSGGGGLLLCVMLLGCARRLRGVHLPGIIVVFMMVCGASDAGAQQAAGVQGALSTQQFRPMPGGSPESLGAVAGARLLPHGELSAGVLTHYGYRPVVLVDRQTDQGVDVLRHQVQSELVIGMGVGEWLELGMALPVIWQQVGSDQVPGGGVSSRGVGDARVSLRAGSKRGRQRGVFVAGGLQLSLPTGSKEAWQSDAALGFEPGVLMTWRGARASVSANLGYLVRGSDGVLNASGGQMLRWGVGGAVPIVREDVEGFVEVFGSAAPPRADRAWDVSNYPAEALAGLRVWVQRSHQLSVSAGPGLTRGYGTPTARLIAGYRFVPARAFASDDRGPQGDQDADGVINRDDACPDLAEDLDGFEDEDGCPDWDNDRDELRDDVDACPNSPEDRDGFEDEDGCPDEDDDRDGVPDLEDRCPHVPEDLDDVEDEDGCPEFDNDLDGLVDSEDACVLDAEDFDGFEDEDGCPDPDNDRDGVPDVRDECPEQQEVFNGFEDEDGCPDEVEGDEVAWTMDRILLGEAIYFDTDRAKLQERSRPVLRKLAEFLLAHPEIELVEIQGHTDDKGSQAWNMDLSWRRAENVRKYLLRRGVSADRLIVMGYGKVRPLGEGESESVRAKNRRVEFRIRRLSR